MGLPGIAFFIATVVGIGLAAYMFYSMEEPSSNSYRSNDESRTYTYSYPQRAISSHSSAGKRRRRRGSNNSSVTSTTSCIICCDSLEAHTTTLLACEHRFHTLCIDRWCQQQRTCPLCRSRIY